MQETLGCPFESRFEAFWLSQSWTEPLPVDGNGLYDTEQPLLLEYHTTESAS